MIQKVPKGRTPTRRPVLPCSRAASATAFSASGVVRTQRSSVCDSQLAREHGSFQPRSCLLCLRWRACASSRPSQGAVSLWTRVFESPGPSPSLGHGLAGHLLTHRSSREPSARPVTSRACYSLSCDSDSVGGERRSPTPSPKQPSVRAQPGGLIPAACAEEAKPPRGWSGALAPNATLLSGQPECSSGRAALPGTSSGPELHSITPSRKLRVARAGGEQRASVHQPAVGAPPGVGSECGCFLPALPDLWGPRRHRGARFCAHSG